MVWCELYYVKYRKIYIYIEGKIGWMTRVCLVGICLSAMVGAPPLPHHRVVADLKHNKGREPKAKHTDKKTRNEGHFGFLTYLVFELTSTPTQLALWIYQPYFNRILTLNLTNIIKTEIPYARNMSS